MNLLLTVDTKSFTSLEVKEWFSAWTKALAPPDKSKPVLILVYFKSDGTIWGKTFE